MNRILPDSRLKSSVGEVVGDWVNNKGDKVRICFQPIHCFNCGKNTGYVPKEITTFVSWLCDDCSQKWGQDADLHDCPDSVFWEHVANEMMDRYGRVLTQQEIWEVTHKNELSSGLQLLERESPYRRMV